MVDLKPWSRAWVVHRFKLAVLIMIVFIMPVILFAIAGG